MTFCHICMFSSCRTSEGSVTKSQALGNEVERKRGYVAEVLDALVPEDSISPAVGKKIYKSLTNVPSSKARLSPKNHCRTGTSAGALEGSKSALQ